MDLGHFKLDTGYLFVSMFWGAVGSGFWIYGKKQRTAPPLFGGVALIAITFLITESALWLSLAGLGILAGIYFWSKYED